jgi:hypothetical protein
LNVARFGEAWLKVPEAVRAAEPIAKLVVPAAEARRKALAQAPATPDAGREPGAEG